MIVVSPKAIDDLTRDWSPSPQLLKGVRVRQRVPIEKMPLLQETMTNAAQQLEGCGRVVVRYSGTEPLLRVMVESDDASRNEVLMSAMIEAIEKEFAAIS